MIYFFHKKLSLHFKSKLHFTKDLVLKWKVHKNKSTYSISNITNLQWLKSKKCTFKLVNSFYALFMRFSYLKSNLMLNALSNLRIFLCAFHIQSNFEPENFCCFFTHKFFHIFNLSKSQFKSKITIKATINWFKITILNRNHFKSSYL